MPNGMTTDYRLESLSIVALKFPVTGRPMMLRSSYPIGTWRNIVSHAKRNAVTVQALFIQEDSEEGQAILLGTDSSDITPEFLQGLDDENLREMASRYEVKLNGKNNKKAIALKIMAAIADGVKPKVVGKPTSGE
jgi:hypothetical protein